jgi:two-component system, NarL family, sensor kinase
MDQDYAQIGFFVIVITGVILLLVLLVVNLLLTGRNRRLRYEAEMERINSKQREEIANIRAEIAEATLADVSRDLHDEVGQLLTFSILQLENLPARPAEDKPAMIEEVKQSVRDTLDAIRSISKGLSPDYVNQQGLVKSLELLVNRAAGRTGVKTSMMVSPDFHLANTHHPLIVYRIIRECLTNAMRHGKATRISIVLSSSNNRAEISFFDNGIGMNERPEARNSLGWRNMQHYANLMNGQIRINTENDKGTEIFLNIPNHPN